MAESRKPASDACSPHGWTLDTLETFFTSKIESVVQLANEQKERTNERFESSEKAVSAALVAVEKSNAASMASSEKAILKAEAAQDKRNEASNEIRAAMVDQQGNFAAKSETDFRFTAIGETLAAISKRIDGIDLALSVSSGKSQGVGTSTSVLVQIIATGASVAAMIGVIFALMR